MFAMRLTVLTIYIYITLPPPWTSLGSFLLTSFFSELKKYPIFVSDKIINNLYKSISAPVSITPQPCGVGLFPRLHCSVGLFSRLVTRHNNSLINTQLSTSLASVFIFVTIVYSVHRSYRKYRHIYLNGSPCSFIPSPLGLILNRRCSWTVKTSVLQKSSR